MSVGPSLLSLGHLEEVWARDLPSLMPVCLFLLPHPHLLFLHCHLMSVLASLDSILSIGVFFASWASTSTSWGISLCTFLAPSGSLLCLSLVTGSHLSLPVTFLSVTLVPACLSISVLGPAILSHFVLFLAPLPAHLSSNDPSSPLSPNLSAVSPIGSASCSRCSCMAAWGQWLGATSPQ